MADTQLGTDIRFNDDVSASHTGDLAVVSGFNNLAQAIGNRLRTVRGSLPEDADYGSDLFELVSDPDLPAMQAFVSHAIRVEAQKDPRVTAVGNVTVGKRAQDEVEFTAGVQAIDGTSGTVGGSA